MDEAELPRLYRELAALGARAEGQRVPWTFDGLSREELLVLAAQASRQEPRLLWVVVELLARRYDVFNPLALRRALSHARWPAALAVALDFARKAIPSQELDDLAAFVTARVVPANNERFFLGTRAFGGALARRDVEESLAEYTRWGYFSREEPLAKELGSPARGSLARPQRMNLLRRIAGQKEAITARDYLDALRGRASRRQASRDLAEAPFLEASGTTRGVTYRLSPSPPLPPSPSGRGG